LLGLQVPSFKNQNDLKILIQLLGFLLLLYPVIGEGQNLIKPPHPIFTPFKGTVYKMPRIRRQIGNILYNKIQEHYDSNIYDYEKIGKIGLKRLNIPETAINERNFPGVQQKIKFAMILTAKVKIELAACYEFSLSSDDGSILWIDSTLVVNNDGGHQMKMKKDSTVLKKGIYPVKVWYFQGMPDRYGLILDAKIIGKVDVCPDKKIAPEKEEKVVKFSLNGEILFESAKYELKAAAITEINRIAKIILQQNPREILIIGHTDNVGNFNANQLLSLERAATVRTHLSKLVNNPAIKFKAIGKGDESPIATNDSTENRAKNRRVEIILNP